MSACAVGWGVIPVNLRWEARMDNAIAILDHF